MARTRCRFPRRVLVVSLRVQNPTAVETIGKQALGVTTRARNRRIAAAVAALPEEILAFEIFVRLPARDIRSCRAVCRHWRILASTPDFLLAHHRCQPTLLLLTLYGTASTDPTFERGRPVLGLTDVRGFKIKASCDGLLLLSSPGDRFSICNSVTRQCAPLPWLTAAGRINIAALYIHRPSGEYRVLYWKGKSKDHLKAAYYILTVRQGGSDAPRCIGVPSDENPSTHKAMLAWNQTATIKFSQPVLFRDYLHWDLACNTSILVFDTVVESFRLMRRPSAATTSGTRLCHMEGSIGFSCFGGGKTSTKIWVLEDYEREVWSFKYRVKFPAESLRRLRNCEDARHLVLCREGGVLVYSRSYGYMLHCDNTGKLLEEFRCGRWSMTLTGPWFKESLVKHNFFLRQDCEWIGQLRFF